MAIPTVKLSHVRNSQHFQGGDLKNIAEYLSCMSHANAQNLFERKFYL